MLALLEAPGRSAVWPASRRECLKTLRFLSVKANLTCKLRAKMDVGSLGGKWAGRLMNRPWRALENMFLPESKMLKNPSCFASDGQSDLRFASEI